MSREDESCWKLSNKVEEESVVVVYKKSESLCEACAKF